MKNKMSPPCDPTHFVRVVPIDSVNTPFLVRLSHALALAALNNKDPEIIAGLGWMQTITAASPSIAKALKDGADDLVGSVIMPSGSPVTFNGVNLTAVLRRLLDVQEKPSPRKAPRGKAVAKRVRKPRKAAKPVAAKPTGKVKP